MNSPQNFTTTHPSPPSSPPDSSNPHGPSENHTDTPHLPAPSQTSPYQTSPRRQSPTSSPPRPNESPNTTLDFSCQTSYDIDFATPFPLSLLPQTTTSPDETETVQEKSSRSHARTNSKWRLAFPAESHIRHRRSNHLVRCVGYGVRGHT